jgi:Ca2+-binding EF-hand superfamily protein
MGMFGNLFGSKKPDPPPPSDPDAPPPDVKTAPPSKQDIANLQKSGKFVFTKPEMTKLKGRFEKISNAETGLIDKSVLYQQPEFGCCLAMVVLITENVIKAPEASTGNSTTATPSSLTRASTFKRKVNEQLTYSQFLEIFSFLSPKTSKDVKIKFLFDALDAAGDGLLEMDDMFRFYQSVLGSKISHALIRQMAAATLDRVGKDHEVRKTKVIDFEKFKNVVDHRSLEEKLTIHF